MKIFNILILIVFISCQNASNVKVSTSNYDLETPSQIWKLPRQLDEISGITMSNNETIFCINDEEGIIYEYNLGNKTIENQFTFGKNNDYEDVAIVADSLFVLQSNGKLFSINSKKEVTKHSTFLTQKQDTEGLCYDKKKHQLLIACKNKVDKKITVYGFDLKTNQLQKQPLIAFSAKDLRNKNFAPSGLAINPKTNTFFIISSVGKTMIEINLDWKIINEFSLNYYQFSQPEGIMFAKNGDLYISNEGKNSKATILKFNYLQ